MIHRKWSHAVCVACVRLKRKWQPQDGGCCPRTGGVAPVCPGPGCSLRVSRAAGPPGAQTHRDHAGFFTTNLPARGSREVLVGRDAARRFLEGGLARMGLSFLLYFPVTWLALPCAAVHGRVNLPSLHVKGSCSSQQIKHGKVAALSLPAENSCCPGWEGWRAEVSLR